VCVCVSTERFMATIRDKIETRGSFLVR